MPNDYTLVRMHLAERIPPGGVDEDTSFLDAELELLYGHHNGYTWAIVADGWAIKAAELAHLIDMVEEGSERRLSQRYKHALSQAQHYADRADLAAEELLEARRVSVAPISAPWGVPADSSLPSDPTHDGISMFSGSYGYTRTYPLHRSFQIKR